MLIQHRIRQAPRGPVCKTGDRRSSLPIPETGGRLRNRPPIHPFADRWRESAVVAELLRPIRRLPGSNRGDMRHADAWDLRARPVVDVDGRRICGKWDQSIPTRLVCRGSLLCREIFGRRRGSVGAQPRRDRSGDRHRQALPERAGVGAADPGRSRDDGAVARARRAHSVRRSKGTNNASRGSRMASSLAARLLAGANFTAMLAFAKSTRRPSSCPGALHAAHDRSSTRC
jgi:hypothetical protein